MIVDPIDYASSGAEGFAENFDPVWSVGWPAKKAEDFAIADGGGRRAARGGRRWRDRNNDVRYWCDCWGCSLLCVARRPP